MMCSGSECLKAETTVAYCFAQYFSLQLGAGKLTTSYTACSHFSLIKIFFTKTCGVGH